MAKDYYLPDREDQLVIWYATFAQKLAAYITLLQISAAELAAVVAESLMVAGAVEYAEAVRNDGKEVVAWKRHMLYGPAGGPNPAIPGGTTPPALSPLPPGILIRLRALVQRIKAHPNYTLAIGQDLGIIGAENAASGSPKPLIRASVSGGHEVTIDFTKGVYDGVIIECRRAGETAWTLLAIDNYSPHVDNRPLLVPGAPEVREYRAQYRLKDVPVGQYSDAVSVVVGA